MGMFIRQLFFKSVFLFIITSYYSVRVYSQERVCIEFSIGTSIPLPPFSQKDNDKAGAGFAKPGGLINLKILKRIRKEKFDLGLAIRGNINGFDSKPITETYEKNNPATYDDWDRKVKGWTVISLMPGIIYNSSLNKKTQLNAGLYLGASYAQSQKFTLTGNSVSGLYSSNVVFIQKRADAFALSTSLQTGFYFTLTSKLDFAINVDYFFLKPTFKNVETITYGITTGAGGTSTISIFHYEGKYNFVQNMNTLNLSAGLKLNL